jgi:23S rRNA (cytidine1920-2'-O)/16S rRNA (cytidine1409-2'-O)-methyltransferase
LKLSVALTYRELVATEKEAMGLILAGKVLVNDKPVTKSGTIVQAEDFIRIRGLTKFVSRAGLKLDRALNDFNFPVAGRTFLDIGASTGGFTDALLQRGAAHVTAIDVGKGLLHQKLRVDKRVSVMEGCDIRDVMRSTLPVPIEAFVGDVSFLSIEAFIAHAFSLLTPASRQAEAILLFKPQFELGRNERNLLTKGVLTDSHKATELIQKLAEQLHKYQISLVQTQPASIKGRRGNQEYVIHLARQ